MERHINNSDLSAGKSSGQPNVEREKPVASPADPAPKQGGGDWMGGSTERVESVTPDHADGERETLNTSTDANQIPRSDVGGN